MAPPSAVGRGMFMNNNEEEVAAETSSTEVVVAVAEVHEL